MAFFERWRNTSRRLRWCWAARRSPSKRSTSRQTKTPKTACANWAAIPKHFRLKSATETSIVGWVNKYIGAGVYKKTGLQSGKLFKDYAAFEQALEDETLDEFLKLWATKQQLTTKKSFTMCLMTIRYSFIHLSWKRPITIAFVGHLLSNSS